VTAKIHPLRNAGAAISAAAGASGNDVTVNGFSLDIGDDAALVAAARRQAFASARSAADEYAGLAGRRLGPVVTVSETVQHSEVPIDPKLAGAAGAAAPLPVQPGRQPVTVEVTVEWSLG
jgi:uncharacterized protein YggE